GQADAPVSWPAEDGIRERNVTGLQTCALPISLSKRRALMLGAQTYVGSPYNLLPGLYHDIFEAFNERDIAEVRRLQRKSMEYIRLIDQYDGYNGAAKGVMKLLGIDCGPARLPLQTITDDELGELENELREKDFFEYAAKWADVAG